MSDEKVSQLSQVSPVLTADWVNVLRSDGGGGFISKKATISDIVGLSRSLFSSAGAPLAYDGTTGVFTIAVGSSAGTVCAGNDSRLSDARTPIAHNHNGADINAGTIGTARLGSGTADATTFLRGDSSWQVLVTGADRLKLDGTNSMTGPLNITQAVIIAAAPILNLGTTWNNVAVVFTGIKLNATITAADPLSQLLDLQKGGTSQFSVDQAGNITTLGKVITNSEINIIGPAGGGTSTVRIFKDNFNLTIDSPKFNCIAINASSYMKAAQFIVPNATLTDIASSLELNATWNFGDGGLAFITMNLTDLDSSTTDAYIVGNKGGVTNFTIDKNGRLLFGLRTPSITVMGDYSIASNISTVRVNGDSSVNVLFPAANANDGRFVFLKDIGGNGISVSAAAGAIDSISGYTAAVYQADSGANRWRLLSGITSGGGAGAAAVSGTGDPTGVVLPDFTLQFYVDTGTPKGLWQALGPTNTDWFQWS